MSHLIISEGYNSACSNLKIPNRFFVSPKYRNLIKIPKFINRKSEKLFLRNIFRELSVNEKDFVRKKTQRFIKKQQEKMKKFIFQSPLYDVLNGRNCIKPYIESKRENIMTDPSYEGEEFIKQTCKKENRIKVLKQTKAISEEKDTYADWLNQTQNSPVKSPNYSRMNFLLEKIKEDSIPFHNQYFQSSKTPKPNVERKQLKKIKVSMRQKRSYGQL